MKRTRRITRDGGGGDEEVDDIQGEDDKDKDNDNEGMMMRP